MIEIGKVYRTRNGEREVTIVGDWNLDGSNFIYNMIGSDRKLRRTDGRILGEDANHPLDLVEEV